MFSRVVVVRGIFFIKAIENSRGWENSRHLCKASTSSRVCITVSNSPSPSCGYIRLCKHGKRFLLLKQFRIEEFAQRSSDKTAEVMDCKRTLILTLKPYNLCKMESLELNLKMPKTGEKKLYKGIKAFLCKKKKLRKTRYIRKITRL